MRNHHAAIAALLALLLWVGCGGDDTVPEIDAAPGSSDAAPTADAGPSMPDAAPPLPETREVTSGAGRVSGGGFVMDVRIGHGLETRN